MTRRTAAAPTASPTGSRSSASADGPGRAARAKPAARPSPKAKAEAASVAKNPKATSKRPPRKKPSSAKRTSKSKATVLDVAPVGPTRRGRARRGQGDQLREEILDATHDLLVETGSADRVSTRAVAQRVGCSSPALYLHFPDKAALLWAVCNRQFRRLGELAAATAEGIDDPIEALRAVGRAYVIFGVEHPEEYRVMMMVPDTVLMWNPSYADLPEEAGFDILIDLLARAMASGQLRQDDVTLVAITVWSAVHGLVALHIAKPAFEWPPIDDLVDRMLAMVTEGLGPGDETDRAATNG